MELIVSRAVHEKLERHRTTPPTLWFIARTDLGRLLKVIFIQDEGVIYLKSAFEPNDIETGIYSRHGRQP